MQRMPAFLLTWSPQRFAWTDLPRMARRVDLVYDVLLDPARDAILPREALRWGKLARMHWDTQSSGVRIPDEVVAELERTWASLSKQR
jgi:hypothetical protein